MNIRWFLSGKIRHATEMCKHVRKLLKAQSDILAPAAVDEVNTAIGAASKAIDGDDATLTKRLEELEKVANTKLKPYPSPEWRENIEVLLVAIAVAMAIRTFFLQPFKIPTSSMQPTLYGVTVENFRTQPDVNFPGFGKRMVDACVRGTFYHRVVAPDDCELLDIRYKQVSRFINKHEFVVRLKSGETKALSHWFSTDERMSGWAELQPNQQFKKGEDILKLKEVTGDHLFVDRVTYNFRRPERGEIIVFKTRGIPRISNQDQFYIKRLVGLGDEKLQIGDDHHVRINDQSLNASTPRFENLYGFAEGQSIEDSKYAGHGQAGYLSTEAMVFDVRPKHYFALGDNTSVSADSRVWGDLPQQNVIGKAFFVYWPIANRGGSRFGLGYR